MGTDEEKKARADAKCSDAGAARRVDRSPCSNLFPLSTAQTKASLISDSLAHVHPVEDSTQNFLQKYLSAKAKQLDTK